MMMQLQTHNDKGIFVIHQQAPYSSTNNIRVKTSNGQWNWENPFTSNCFGGAIVPAFKTTSVNRSGRNNRDELIATVGTSHLFSLINESGVGVCGDWLYGGGLNNSFNLTYNDVFSNYSNPWARRWQNDITNNFTMEVIAQNGSVVNAKFYLTSPLNGKPSKPQNPALSSSIPGGYGFVKFSWTTNSEPDLQYYEVWRKVIEYGGNWTLITTTTNSYYIDNEFLYTNPVGDFRLTYKVRVKDNQNLYSIYSDEISCRAETASKKGFLLEGKVSDYNLFQNYPNPFNPITTVVYDVKETGLVQLKVFDILGKEVVELVNGEKENGKYSVVFNASDLPSGVYIYSLRVNDFISNQKMLLIK